MSTSKSCSSSGKSYGKLRREILACEECGLRAGCERVVSGVGPTDARIVIVGEGPGAEESRRGIPFVGASGRLLNKMLESAGIDREAVFVTNVVRCQPPGNRTPKDDEIAACKTWLLRELRLIRPKVVVTLGVTASKLLLRGNRHFFISRWVNQLHKPEHLGGIGLVCLYHPSYMLRGNDEEIGEAVRTLVKVKNYCLGAAT